MTKTCFVIMPISREGSDDHNHFRALYEEIKNPIETMGFVVTRADEVQKGGSITKDIIYRLAQADLVVADLSALNPNVFYELGVRHSLRSQGTIMIIDDARTSNIPFDLNAYRVVKFTSDLPGIGKLRSALIGFIKASLAGEIDPKDNPVHDALPALPVNALQSSTGSTEGELREALAEANQKLKEYEDKFGLSRKLPEKGGGLSPLDLINAALSDAEEGNLPSDLVSRAEEAAAHRDRKKLLSVLKIVVTSNSTRLSSRDLIALTRCSMNLGLEDVTGAIFDFAKKLYTTDEDLRTRHLAYLSHSNDPLVRERARQEMLSDMGIAIVDKSIKFPEKLLETSLALLGTMLDAFHEDKLDEQALQISTVFVTQFHDKSMVLRNHARALRISGRGTESLKFYQSSVWSSDRDDASAIWFGSTLHNMGRIVDAVEVYLLACVLDPDDASGFSEASISLAIVLQNEQIGQALKTSPTVRRLPREVNVDSVRALLAGALACNTVTQSDFDRCRRAASRLQISLEQLSSNEEKLSIVERLQLASVLYHSFRSDVSDPFFNDAGHSAN